MDDRARFDRAGKRDARIVAQGERRTPLRNRVGGRRKVGGCRKVPCAYAKNISFPKEETTELGVTDARRIFQHRRKRSPGELDIT